MFSDIETAPPQKITHYMRQMMIKYSMEDMEDSPCKDCLCRPCCSELCQELYDKFQLSGIVFM